jgi:hypothetical protein
MRRWSFVPLVFTLACGSKEQPHELSAMNVTKLSVTAGFDVDAPELVQIFASLAYERVGDECEALPISAELDGEALAPSPSGTGKLGADCRLGFYLDAPVSDSVATSKVSFVDDSAEVSLGIQSLLAHRALVSELESDSTLTDEMLLVFAWSVDSDELTSADAFFTQGSETVTGEVRKTGNEVGVVLPELASGGWRVALGAVATASVSSCEGAAQCVATVAGNGELRFQLE